MYTQIIEEHPLLGFIGWNQHDPDKVLCDRDRDRLVERLLTIYMPNDLKFKKSDQWTCRNIYKMVTGAGESPEQAYRDYQQKLRTTWHGERLDTLFRRIRRQAAIHLTMDTDKEAAQDHVNEVERFIASFYEGKLTHDGNTF